ncbi:MAG: NlpC/P60 family protein [Nocardioidaceae bacterium]
MSTRVRNRAVALCAAAVLTIALGPSAHADHHDPVIPSEQDVIDAQQHVLDAARSVSAIQADLAAANQQLEDLAVAAEQAAEAYNGALVHYQTSKTAAITARQRADRAATKTETARASLAGFVVSQDTTGSDLTTFSTALTAGGPHDLLTNISNYDTSSQAFDAHYQAWNAASQLSKVYRAQAEKALTEAADAKLAAQEARKAAQVAVDAQQAAVVSIGAQRQALIEELAKAQNVSVSVAAQRQQGLEQRRQERIAEQRRLEQLAQQRKQHREQVSEQLQLREQQQAQERRQARRDRHEQRQHHNHPAPPAPPTTPPPAPPTTPPPAPHHHPHSSTSAQKAVDFAYDQIGEPYVWGADGPDSWDCSGLTMGAWASADVTLPHYSVAQYSATTAITVSQLRPGDLVFWASDSSDPGTIFHVGLYIGNGNMIHAPHTGSTVRIESIWYWETPDFFGRP